MIDQKGGSGICEIQTKSELRSKKSQGRRCEREPRLRGWRGRRQGHYCGYGELQRLVRRGADLGQGLEVA